ncbi:MAG TPA: LptA/OstA family protein [Sumerlaeia bacterium]|nr:LptA/OstA family protein [Sumerlaeia bacterium]
MRGASARRDGVALRPLSIVLIGLFVGWSIAVFPAQAQPGGFSFGGDLGEDFDLKVNDKDGTLEWEMNEKGEFDKLIAKKDVRLKSDKLNMECDVLTYSVGQEHITAFGQPVKLRQADVVGTCKNFVYDLKDGRMVLTGSPVVEQKIKGGKSIGKSYGEKITIVQKENGGTKVMVDPGTHGAGLQHTSNASKPDASKAEKGPRAPNAGTQPAVIEVEPGGSGEKEPREKPKTGPIPIDRKKLDKIPEVNLEEE